MTDKKQDPNINVNIDAGTVAPGGQVIGIQYKGLSPDEAKELFDLLQQKKDPVWDGEYPYRGLVAFQESDAKYFFGREKLVDQLLERIQVSPFVVIAGPSGSGKSSIARAGLLNALRLGRLEKSKGWLLALMQPKGDPFEELAKGLEVATGSIDFGDNIRRDPTNLHRLLAIHLKGDKDKRLVLLIDQFEELFTQTRDPEKRERFIDLLAAITEAEESQIIVVATLRSDFISNCVAFPKLRELMNQQLQLVGAMEPFELAKAITLPALAVGAEIDPRLVSQIMEDMKGEPGALPLMSFALRDLFEAEKSEIGKPMDLLLEEYLDRGGIEKALERHAESVFGKFDSKQKELTKSIFSNLITIGQGHVDTRRTATFSELVQSGATDEETQAVVNALARARLTTVSADAEDGEDGAEGSITIAHERLIDAWPWLRKLVDENRDTIALLNQINSDAKDWTKDRDEGYLYRGGRLSQLLEEHWSEIKAKLSRESTEFVEAAIQQRDDEAAEIEARRKEQEDAKRREQELIAEQREQELIAENRAQELIAKQREQELVAKQRESELLAEQKALELTAAKEKQQAAEELATEQGSRVKSIKQFLALTSLLLVLAVAAAVVALTARKTAEVNERIAIAQTTLANAQSLQRGNQLQLSTLLAIISSKKDSLPEAEEILRQNVSHLPIAKFEHNIDDDPLTDVKYSSNGEQIVIVSRDKGIAFVYDSLTGDELKQFHVDGFSSVFAISPDSSRLAVDDNSRTGNRYAATIFDFEARGSLIPPRGVVDESLFSVEHGDYVLDIVFSNDGTKIASVSADHTICIAAVATRENIYPCFEAEDIVVNVTFSADDQWLLTGGKGGTLWDVTTGSKIKSFPHESYVLSVAFSADEKYVATAGTDERVKVWEISSGELLFEKLHSGWVNRVVFSPDGKWLATASNDRYIRRWNIEAFPFQEQQMLHDGPVVDLAFDMESRWLASVSKDRTARLWDAVSGQELAIMSLNGEGAKLHFHPDGSQLVTTTGSGHWQIWEFSEIAVPKETFFFEQEVVAAVTNANGSAIFTGGRDFMAHFWERDSNKPISLPGHTALINAIAVTSDGLIATGSDDETVILWNSRSGEMEQTLQVEAEVTSLAFNPAGTLLVTVDRRGRLMSWDVMSGENKFIQNHTNFPDLSTVAFHPNGETFATGGADGSVLIWDADEGQVQSTLSHGNRPVLAVAYTSDGKWLLTSGEDGLLRRWDVEQLHRFKIQNSSDKQVLVHPDAVNGIDIAHDPDHPDGPKTWLATAGADGVLRLWDVVTWSEVARVSHSGPINSVSFSADGREIITTSENAVLIWDIEELPKFTTQELISAACDRVTRDLNGDQRKSYIGNENARGFVACKK